MPLFPASSALAWKAGALLSSTGIMAGAFGAHALAPRLGEKTATWTMASHYAIVNGVALLAISQHPIYSKRWSAPLIIVGTTLFSGSIFALLLYREKMGALTKIVGPATPLGGLLMIGGYLSLVGPCALHLTPD
ncbi:BZ3500_MvSof-1268-A1-R1_Chr7-1g09215 [Microbotryum saponariae]|uniref:BZ3500_MvSof-1268-A1-R1_Chr7-1g09215 protein n=1 Tax=Microbotryum saponariae TaxID=289078 RepID=A0A2X0N0C3_9BASI|nr:BZ3501_MvSof-1269-A2-R1_Chr7-1g08920 [Microbotryum saponariae]SDA03012.1 BZ3500_MvSof-1268-A1-R1_Chr7-1g09215 [Microbotryum saponariae]